MAKQFFKTLIISVSYFVAAQIGVYSASVAAGVYGAHPGYLETVDGERDQRVVEMVLLNKPKRRGKPIRDVIFDEELTREFKNRYEDRFGYTDAQQQIVDGQFFNFADRFAKGSIDDVEREEERKRTYGEFMMKRLTEHHLDRYTRNSPTLRPAYDLKERISKVDLEVKKGYKFKMRYSFSGNNMDFSLENPYDVESKISLIMPQDQFGPGEVSNTLLTLGYPFTKTVKVTSHYSTTKGDASLIGTKRLTKSLSTSLSGQTRLIEKQTSTYGDLYLLGLTWSN